MRKLYAENLTGDSIITRDDPQRVTSSFFIAEKSADRMAEQGFADFKLGRYLHYKGNEYETIAVAEDANTQALLVAYRSIEPSTDHTLYVRGLAEFSELLDVDGARVPRFMYLGPIDANSGRSRAKR
jgi:hypothetical protein